MVIPQGCQMALTDRVFFEVLSAVVGERPGYKVLDVIVSAELLQALDRQGQELDEDMKAAVFRFNGKRRAAVEFFEETRRFVHLLIPQVREVLRAEEVKNGPNDASAFPPTPLLNKKMA